MNLTAGLGSIVVLLIFLALGMPVGIALLTGGFAGLLLLTGSIPTALGIFATGPYRAVGDFNLTVLPLFVLMGAFANQGGIGTAAFRVGEKWIGWLPGGLAVAATFGCAAFGAACGSSAATSAVFAKLSLPEMEKYGYNIRMATGTIAAGGILGMLIPPSTLAIIYGILTEVPISKLLMGGAGPGILYTLIFSLGIVVMVILQPKLAPGGRIHAPWRERFGSLVGLWGIVLLAVIVLGGIYSGIFTPTEAASVGAAATFIMFAAGNQRSWKRTRTAFFEAGATTAMIFLILIGATIFSRMLALSGMTQAFASLITNSGWSAGMILTLFLAMYFLLGCFLDSISMMALTLPTVYPLSLALGFDPVWFGTMVIVTIEIGLLTPPVGLNVYVVKAVAGDRATLEDVFRGSMPFVIMLFIGVAILIAFPSIITWLPNQMFG